MHGADLETKIDKSGHVLVVDDEGVTRRILEKGLTSLKHRCAVAEDAASALKYLEANRDIDIALVDINMPGMNGIELCKRIKESYEADVIIMTSGYGDFSYADAIEKGASDFILKPVDLRELRLRVRQVLDHREILFELKGANEQQRVALETLRKGFGNMIQVLTAVTEIRDPYTAGHQRRVSDLARAIATDLGLSEFQIQGIRMASAVHDIGKIGVPAEILVKPTKLTPTEFELIKAHPQIGYDLLKEVQFPWPIDQIVLQHHWRLNGSGYPEPIGQDEYLLESKIIGVADVVEAMVSHRPYRPALGIKKALAEVQSNKGNLYDPFVADSCIRLFESKAFEFK